MALRNYKGDSESFPKGGGKVPSIKARRGWTQKEVSRTPNTKVKELAYGSIGSVAKAGSAVKAKYKGVDVQHVNPTTHH